SVGSASVRKRLDAIGTSPREIFRNREREGERDRSHGVKVESARRDISRKTSRRCAEGAHNGESARGSGLGTRGSDPFLASGGGDDLLLSGIPQPVSWSRFCHETFISTPLAWLPAF